MRQVLSELAPLVNAQQGVIYQMETDESSEMMLLSAYADDAPNGHARQLRVGEGLVGQCAAEKRRMLITEVPPHAVPIRSGLFKAVPLNVIVLPIAERSQIVLAGHAEAALLTGLETPDAAAQWFADHGVTMVAIKLGADGALGVCNGTSYHGAALSVHPADPIGAGDAFDAGFLCAWLRGAQVAECVDDGNLAAGLSIQVCGDIEGLPYSHEMQERRANNLETNR